MDLHSFFGPSKKVGKKVTADRDSKPTSGEHSQNDDDDDFQATPVRPRQPVKDKKRKASEDENRTADAIGNKSKMPKPMQEIDPKEFFASTKKPSKKKTPKSMPAPVDVMDVDAPNETVTKEDARKTAEKIDLSADETIAKKDNVQTVVDLTKGKTVESEASKKIAESPDADKEKEVDDVKVSETSEKKEPATMITKNEKQAAPVDKLPAPTEAQKPSNKANTSSESSRESAQDTPEKKMSSHPASTLNRDGPRALGTRPLPRGQADCLKGMIFVFTGELDTITKDTAADIVKRYGGQVTSDINSMTTYLIRGRGATMVKTAKAEKFKVKILDEDGFYKLIENSRTPVSTTTVASSSKGEGKQSIPATTPVIQESIAQLWTDKYRPKTINEVLGNKEVVKRISNWLANWQKNFSSNFAQTKVDDGIESFRAVLISGPPGIGKTTTAHVVGATHGYEVLEFNASDVRNKKALEENILEMVDNRTMTEFISGSTKMVKESKNVLLVMDEVDGMSSGDRGGSVELAALIKKTKIPIICICNDVRSPKVAPLLRVCYDARFKRTPANQLRARILTIAYREKLSITPNAIDELVSATGNDIRQIINILSTYRLSSEKLDYDQAKTLGKVNEKNTQMNLFDIPGVLFNSSSWRTLNLAEKSEIYFQDYSLTPLMVFENYPKCIPDKPTRLAKTGSPREIACLEMKLFAEAAESIADGDLVDTAIHGSLQQYSLMPVQSIFSCVRPASSLNGVLTQKMSFPSWLGQNSKAGKYHRLLDDMQSRLRLKTTADKYGIRQSYVPTLSQRIFSYLKNEKYDEAMQVMDTYYLEREMLETLNDFDMSGKKPLTELPAKQKKAFTRKYNSSSHPTVIQVGLAGIKKGKGSKGAAASDIQDSDGEVDDRDYGGHESEEEELLAQL